MLHTDKTGVIKSEAGRQSGCAALMCGDGCAAPDSGGQETWRLRRCRAGVLTRPPQG